MVCYYPQDTTLAMGPTELLPGSQYHRGDSDRAHYSRGHIPCFGEQVDEWATLPTPVLCRAGSVLVTHFDLWHRALESTTDSPRLMLKFVAWRTAHPTISSPADWPLVDHRGTEEGHEAEGERGGLLDFLGAGGGALRASELPSSAGRRPRKAAGPPPIPAEALCALGAHLESAPASVWAGGVELLRCKDVSRAEVLLFESAVERAKAMAAGGAFETSQLGRVVAWLGPQCARVAAREASAARRRRFVRDRAPIWRHVWRWLHGQEGAEGAAPACLPRLVAQLSSAAEPERLCAAYALARSAPGAVALLAAMLSPESSTSVRRTATYGCVASGAVDASTLERLVAQSSRVRVGTEDEAEGAAADGDSVRTEAAGQPLLARENGPADGYDGRAWRPVGSGRAASTDGWMAACVVREADGFDAECMMAVADPSAAALYAATLAFARGARVAGAGPRGGEDVCGVALRLLRGPAATALSISVRLVLLESLGLHGGASPHAASRLASQLVADTAVDGAARAVGARVLSQLAARSIQDSLGAGGPRGGCRGGAAEEAEGGGLGLALAACVTPLATALGSDPDRYVRGHAAEALASVAMREVAEGFFANEAERGSAEEDTAGTAHAAADPRAHLAAACSPAHSVRARAAAALAPGLPPGAVDAVASRLRERLGALPGRGSGCDEAGRAALVALAVHDAVRALCAQRRCPLTHPESPF